MTGSWRSFSAIPGGFLAEIAAVQAESIEDREWSRSTEAQQLMASMFGKTKDCANITSQPKELSMDNYLSHRGFLPSNSATASSLSPAHRTCTATLTFPLTTAYGLRRVFGEGIRKELQKDELNILIVGARSESSLPAIWWKETLLSSMDVIGTKLSVSFMGPGLQHPGRQAFEYKHENKCVAIRHVNLGANVLHEHQDCMKLLLETDMFCLFNPGFGSTAALQESWSPTLKLLLMTRKPVLATAHSAFDLKRDLAFLERITNAEDHQDLGEPLEFLFNPHPNPAASSKRTFDSKEEPEAQVVTTNQFVYAFQAK